MNPSLAIFAGICLVVIGGMGFFLRGALFNITTAAAEHAKIYAVAYVKGGALILLAMLASFDENFRNLTKEAAVLLPWWGWTILYLKPIAAALAVLVAFLDRSVQRGGEEAANLKAAKSGTAPPFPSATAAPPPS